MKTVRVKEAAGNSSEVMRVTVQEAAGNSSEVLKIILKGPGCTTTICQSRICRYVDKVFENLRQKLRLSSCTLDAKTNVLIW